MAAMLRPPLAQAGLHGRTSTLAQSAALIAALLATAAALAMALLAWLERSASSTAPSVLPWLLAVGMACVAAAAGWTLWRQRELANALRYARMEVDNQLELSSAWTWRSDSAHRLTRWQPPIDEPAPWTSRADAIGKTLWELFDADPGAAAALCSRLQAGIPVRAQIVALRVGDDAVQSFELRAMPLTDETGRIEAWMGTARALDAVVACEHDQRLLRALLPTLSHPVLELAGRERVPACVRRGNLAAAQWLGITAGELAGLGFADLLGRLPQDLRRAVTHAVSAPEGGAERPACALWDVKARLVDPPQPGRSASGDSERSWVLVLVPIQHAETAPAAAGGEHESFSYTVSHDLRAPIRVVEGFTKILKEDYGRQLDRIGNDHLDRVLGAAARMNSMIDALLALSQLSSRPLSHQPVDLSQLAAYVVEDLRRQSPERSVTVHLDTGLLTQGDPTLLRVVLENLIGNAWKYTARTRGAQIWLERGQHNGLPVFTVRDNGAGFDMRFADRLFGVFQRLHSASDFPGTGIGLASVRRIIGRHGGEIWAESAVDHGSSFYFTIATAHTAG